MHFLLGFAVLFGAAGALGQAKSSAPQTHTIVISDMKFTPDKVEVHKGDTILWKNEDIVPHTVTAKGVFDSKEIMPDKEFKFKVNQVGTWSYGCSFHPTMKGSVVSK